MKKLYRSCTDKKFAGIAGGLAEYFNIDATVVRLLFVLLLFLTGGGFLFVYLIAIFVIPERKD